MLVTHRADRLKLRFRIKRAVFGRLRDVDETRVHHVLVAPVVLDIEKRLIEHRGGHLAALLRNREHLVTAELDRARLMHGDVAGLSRYHALIPAQHRVDYRGVCLRAADEEVDPGVRSAAGLADLILRRERKFVVTVARFLQEISFRETLQNRGVRAFLVVTGERKTRSVLCHDAGSFLSVICVGLMRRPERGARSRASLKVKSQSIVFNITFR